MFGLFPLIALSVIAFNAVVFFGGTLFGVEGTANAFDSVVASFGMMSSDTWTITLGDIFVVVTMILLFVEIVKATHTGTATIINHALSMLVFIICLVEFIMFNGFGNSTFFLIMLMALLDVVAGFTVTISTARRDLGVGAGIFEG